MKKPKSRKGQHLEIVPIDRKAFDDIVSSIRYHCITLRRAANEIDRELNRLEEEAVTNPTSTAGQLQTRARPHAARAVDHLMQAYKALATKADHAHLLRKISEQRRAGREDIVICKTIVNHISAGLHWGKWRD